MINEISTFKWAILVLQYTVIAHWCKQAGPQLICQEHLFCQQGRF